MSKSLTIDSMIIKLLLDDWKLCIEHIWTTGETYIIASKDYGKAHKDFKGVWVSSASVSDIGYSLRETLVKVYERALKQGDPNGQRL